MAKIILNKDYGGFDVSPLAYKRYAEKLGRELFYYSGDAVVENRGIYYTRMSFDEFNTKHGFFSFYSFMDLGKELVSDLAKDDNIEFLSLCERNREDPILIEVVEELGDKASGRFGDLKVVEIPDELANGNYVIDDYDGIETLHAKVDIY